MRQALLASLLLATAALAGCSTGYTHLELEQLSTPLPGTFVAQPWVGWVALPVGTAVGVRAVPMAGDEAIEEPPEVLLESCDPEILGVEDGPSPNEFVLVGRSPGESCIRVLVIGEESSVLGAAVEARRY